MNEKWEKEVEERVALYALMFGENPPILFMIPYTDDIYAEKIKEAVVRGTPITKQELDEIGEAKPYDLDE